MQHESAENIRPTSPAADGEMETDEPTADTSELTPELSSAAGGAALVSLLSRNTLVITYKRIQNSMPGDEGRAVPPQGTKGMTCTFESLYQLDARPRLRVVYTDS